MSGIACVMLRALAEPKTTLRLSIVPKLFFQYILKQSKLAQIPKLDIPNLQFYVCKTVPKLSHLFGMNFRIVRILISKRYKVINYLLNNIVIYCTMSTTVHVKFDS